MPRQNPTDTSPNPCKRWFSWSGDKGKLRYYDKETEENVLIELPFEFVLLDRLATIKGWNDASGGGIYSNEIRSTVDEPLTVRAFEMKEPIARGYYADIKEKVKAAGGKFSTNLYIAFMGDSDDYEIGSIMLHGAALTPWFSFEKENRRELFSKGVRIVKAESGQKGAVKFKTPVFELVDIPTEVEAKAEVLQADLKAYLDKYLARGHQEYFDPKLKKLAEEKAEDETEEVPF